MDEAKRTKTKVIKFTILAALLISVLLIVFTPKKISVGFLIGFIASILNFQLLYIALRNSVKFSPNKARIYGFITYVVRYIIWFFILYAVFMNDQINLIATVVGLMSVKLTVVLGNIFKLWNNDVDIIRKEEG